VGGVYYVTVYLRGQTITHTGGTSSVTWDPREPGAMTDRGARLAVLVADVCRDGSKSC
jgi:hypothetical protein